MVLLSPRLHSGKDSDVAVHAGPVKRRSIAQMLREPIKVQYVQPVEGGVPCTGLIGRGCLGNVVQVPR